MRDRGELRLGGLRRCGRLGRLARRGVGAGGELVRLVRQRTTARVELEQDRLTGLTGEPELAARGVEPVPLRRDARPVGDVEEPIAVDEPDAVEELQRGIRSRRHVPERPCAGNGRLHRVAGRRVHDDVQAPEAAVAGAFEQRECVPRVGRQQRRRTPGEGRCDGLLEPRLDLELADHEALALGGERTGGGGDALPFLERALERREPVARGARPLGEVVALGRGRAGGCAGLVRALLELGRAGRATPGVRAGGRELVREAGR